MIVKNHHQITKVQNIKFNKNSTNEKNVFKTGKHLNSF